MVPRGLWESDAIVLSHELEQFGLSSHLEQIGFLHELLVTCDQLLSVPHVLVHLERVDDDLEGGLGLVEVEKGSGEDGRVAEEGGLILTSVRHESFLSVVGTSIIHVEIFAAFFWKFLPGKF